MNHTNDASHYLPEKEPSCMLCEFELLGSAQPPCNSCHDYFNFSSAVKKAPTRPSSPIFTHHEWETLLATSISSIKELAKLKGGEYAGDVDRLANFRHNATALGLPMESIWAVYAAKHWDALMQYVRDKNEGTSRDRLEPIEGRVDDLLVYLLLFKAILRESAQRKVED